MHQFDEHSLIEACRTIFGGDIDLSREFLYYIQPEGVKSAFRRRVLETHPDRVASEEHRKEQQSALFQNVIKANELLNSFLTARVSNRVSWVPPARPTTPVSRSQANRPPTPSYFRGKVPEHRLPFGRYLYYRGVITQQELIAALMWQSNQRPKIGQIARDWGWIDDPDIRSILAYRGDLTRFGEKALHLSILSREQVQTLLWYQRSNQQKIGCYFVEQGILSAVELDRHLQEFGQHNRRVAAAGSQNA